MKKNAPHSRKKRPTATLDLKAEEVKKEAPTKSGSNTSAPKKDLQASPPDTGKPAASKSTSVNQKSASHGTTSSKKTGQRPAHDKKPPAGGSIKSPPPNRSSGGGGFISHLLASIIGAVMGIFGLSYANNQNMLPDSLKISGGNAMNERVAALTGKINTLQSTISSNSPNSLGSHLNNLNARLEQAEASLGGTQPGADTLAQKVASLETTLGNLERAASIGKGGKLAGLTAVTQQLKKANKQSLALENELVKVREEQNSFRADLTSIRGKQADFISTTANLSDELAKMKNNNAQIVAQAKRPPDVSAQINPVLAKLGTLTSKIDGVLNREENSRAEGRDIALALSLGELKRAVHDGSPFNVELARVAPHAPQGLDLSVLSQHADRGIITITALRSSFSSLSHKALASEHTATSGSFVDQIFANAKSMVQVRPTGLVEGATTGAVLSRMEYKLDRNDLNGALKESSALTGSAKDVMQPWLAQAGSRASGNAVLRALEDKIRNALAGSNSK